MKKWFIISGVVLLLVGLIIWTYIESSKPLPGQQIADLGRGHVPVGTPIDYNSNPPTSGKHYEEWAKAGIYNEPKDDRNLVHSLEHGYIIMSYNCDLKTPSLAPDASLSAQFQSDDCKKLVSQLTNIYHQKGPHKLIVIPRPNLDSKLALTAWNRLDKFNIFDQKRMEDFIDAYRDHGPEQTMEP